jgi:hypothetical protein
VLPYATPAAAGAVAPVALRIVVSAAPAAAPRVVLWVVVGATPAAALGRGLGVAVRDIPVVALGAAPVVVVGVALGGAPAIARRAAPIATPCTAPAVAVGVALGARLPSRAGLLLSPRPVLRPLSRSGLCLLLRGGLRRLALLSRSSRNSPLRAPWGSSLRSRLLGAGGWLSARGPSPRREWTLGRDGSEWCTAGGAARTGEVRRC